jgi:diguanylate cyclase (GGDEF)-like protein
VAAVVLHEHAGTACSLARILRLRPSQPVLVLTANSTLSATVLPLLGPCHDVGSIDDDAGLVDWRLGRLVANSRRSSLPGPHLDPLTGLIVRQEFQVELERAIEVSREISATGLVYLDLDRFKLINDRLGHTAGDEVLRSIANHLRSTLMPRDIVARLGGDEFAWLLRRSTDDEVVRDASDLVSGLSRLAIPELQADPTLRVTASAGLTFVRQGSDWHALMMEVEAAAYEAKNLGRRRVVVYPQMAEEARRANGNLEVRHFENVARVATERLIGALTLQSRALIEAAQREADHCPLTGLYSRRYLDARLPQEFQAARSSQRALSIVMLDLDHFRNINGTYGWPTGDRVLRTFASIVTRNLPAQHWAARYGGEEFLIVMPGRELAEAVRFAETIRVELEASEIESLDGRAVHATLSVGVAQLGQGCGSSTELVDKASQALLRAKTSGRNRIETCEAVNMDIVDESDPFDLQRFVHAQSSGKYEQALDELRRGRKDSHWMWFIFPQLKGLGRSTTARRFGISGLAEARAYLAHPVLGPRLRECARVLMGLPPSCGTALDIFGGVDAMKLRSCLTLFAAAAEADPDFEALLGKYCYRERDELTVAMLMLQGSS